MLRAFATAALAAALVGFVLPECEAQPAAKGVTFRVKLNNKHIGPKPKGGRVLVGVAKAKESVDFTNYRPPVLPILGTDVEAFGQDTVVTLDANSDTFPEGSLAKLPAGEYSVQAIFATNRDINLPDAPGNRYCDPVACNFFSSREHRWMVRFFFPSTGRYAFCAISPRPITPIFNIKAKIVKADHRYGLQRSGTKIFLLSCQDLSNCLA